MVALLVAIAFAAMAWRCRWLTADGAIAAAGVGAVVLEFGGWAWTGALVVFFVSGTTLTRLGRARKAQPEHLG